MRATGIRTSTTTVSHNGWQPRRPLDPCERMIRFGPVRPMREQRSLWSWLLFG